MHGMQLVQPHVKCMHLMLNACKDFNPSMQLNASIHLQKQVGGPEFLKLQLVGCPKFLMLHGADGAGGPGFLISGGSGILKPGIMLARFPCNWR